MGKTPRPKRDSCHILSSSVATHALHFAYDIIMLQELLDYQPAKVKIIHMHPIHRATASIQSVVVGLASIFGGHSALLAIVGMGCWVRTRPKTR